MNWIKILINVVFPFLDAVKNEDINIKELKNDHEPTIMNHAQNNSIVGWIFIELEIGLKHEIKTKNDRPLTIHVPLVTRTIKCERLLCILCPIKKPAKVPTKVERVKERERTNCWANWYSVKKAWYTGLTVVNNNDWVIKFKIEQIFSLVLVQKI